ncbi:MAG: response regulator [Silicimonas sp.]|nr:response regulator [Silicimonas sp.]
MTNAPADSIADEIGRNLPYLRRYARALTGSQSSGDKYAVATLETILADPDAFDRSASSKEALFGVFHAIWTSTGAPVDDAAGDSGLESRAQAHLSHLTPNTREALLLRTVEEFETDEIARIMRIDDAEAAGLIETAYTEMAQSATGRILLIEDEAIIAMDLEGIVSEMGHSVLGVGRTVDGAKRLAERGGFDLILSDIQLADGSSGIDAVNDIIATHGECPVIFITAFPERLLTGEGPEPAFLITKPYTEAQVKSAVSQAMFFSSTETLKA